MKEIFIKKEELSRFVSESTLNFVHSFNVNEKIIDQMEEEGNLDIIDNEIYLLGIDEDGNFIYTESSLYIPFSNAVFFQILDEDYLENIDINAKPYNNEKELQYFKELIEAKFKNKNIELTISYI